MKVYNNVFTAVDSVGETGKGFLAQWKLSRVILVRDIKAISLNWDDNTYVATSPS